MASQDPKPEIAAAEVQDQLNRILGSKTFSLSKRQIAFLKHIVVARLDGQADKLKEYSLGIDVFEKDSSFDPGIDSIVRVEASRLRSKLREYYAEEGSNDPLKIEVPKGHYVPTFSPNAVFTKVVARPEKSTFLNRRRELVLIFLFTIPALYLFVDRFLLDGIIPETVDGIATVSDSQVVRTERSIAVLPFRNRSPVADDVYFVDGIHDDILGQLSKLTSLDKVISRTSVEQYRDTTKTMQEIGDELDVVSVLEGGVQRAGNRVRITVQLINAVSDQHMWSETYDRELTTANIFAIQSEIARQIADELHTSLSTQEQLVLDIVPTENFQAYELYQMSQSIRRTIGLGSQDDVPRLLEQAISLDPEFTLAYVGLARAYIDRYFTLERNESDREKARAAIDKAFELQPGMPEVRVALADYYYKGYLDYDRALEQLNFAIPLAQSNAEAYAIRAFILRRRGDIEESIPDLDHAIDLDPGNFSPYYVLADTYVMLGQYELAINFYDKAIELAPENYGLEILRAYAMTAVDINSPALRELSRAERFAENTGAATLRFRWEIALLERDYNLAMNVIGGSRTEVVSMQFAYYPPDLMRGLTEFLLGDKNRAADYLASAIKALTVSLQDNSEDPRLYSALGLAYAGLGQRDEAIAAADRASKLYPVDNDAIDGPLYVLNFARTYAILGDNDAAITKLTELYSKPRNWYAILNAILRDPTFDDLHNEQAFTSLVNQHSVGN